jgi:hypothetical protein
VFSDLTVEIPSSDLPFSQVLYKRKPVVYAPIPNEAREHPEAEVSIVEFHLKSCLTAASSGN